MSLLQIRMFGPYFGSFLANSYGYATETTPCWHTKSQHNFATI